MEKIISVIVCTYNEENVISRTLDSILAQQCSWPMEIIIGDDHSTDGTLAVCQQYADRYPEVIRIIAREKNVGLVDNYFDCLLHARGKYIADIAGDDEWCDNKKLEKQLTIMEQDEDIVLVHTNYQLRIEETEEIKPAPPYWYKQGVSSGKDMTVSIFTQGNRPLVHLCTSLYRNDTFRQCYNEHPEFFQGRKYPCEDMQLTVFLSTKGKFAYLDEVTLNYSISSTSISNYASYEKQWHFVEGAAQLRYDLATALSISGNAGIKANMQFQVYVLMMHAFRLHRRDLRNKTLQHAEQWHIAYNSKIQLLKAITSCGIAWSACLFIRKIVIALR